MPYAPPPRARSGQGSPLIAFRRTGALFPMPPARALCASVIVPARNEAALLPRALGALARQRGGQGRPLPAARYEVLVLLNNCTDASAAVAARLQSEHPALRLHIAEATLPPGKAHVGTARRLLMDAACRRLGRVGCPRGVILSTDADSAVAPDWIAATLAETAAGADAVGGRVQLIPEEKARLAPHARRLFLLDVGYRRLVEALGDLLDPDPHDPFPRHHQHFGASLAVTASMYARVGGLPALPSDEDVALYRAIRRVDGRFRHSLRVRVRTSARVLGRARHGLADEVQAWTAARGAEPLVEPAAATARRLVLRGRLRRLWRPPNGAPAEEAKRIAEARQIAADLALPPAWLMEGLAHAPHFGALWERVGRRANGTLTAARTEPISKALRALRVRVEALRQAG